MDNEIKRYYELKLNGNVILAYIRRGDGTEHFTAPGGENRDRFMDILSDLASGLSYTEQNVMSTGDMVRSAFNRAANTHQSVTLDILLDSELDPIQDVLDHPDIVY